MRNEAEIAPVEEKEERRLRSLALYEVDWMGGADRAEALADGSRREDTI